MNNLKETPTIPEIEEILEFMDTMTIFISDDYQVEMRNEFPTATNRMIALYKRLTGRDLDLISA